MAAAVWLDYLKAVDEDPLELSELESVAAKLLENGLRQPADLRGADPGEVAEAVGGSVGRKSFARRIVRFYGLTEQAKVGVTDTNLGAVPYSAAPPRQPVLNPGLVELLGSEASAADVAAAISGTKKEINVQELLKEVGCADLPYELQAEAQLWVALAADGEAAVKAGRVAFTYVDLTAKQVLPLWLPADAVGGKSLVPEESWDLAKGGNTVAQLGAALRAVTQTPRCFRSMAQWGAAFLRYVPAAVATKHMSWSTALAHHATVLRIYEETRLTEGESILAIVYDQLQRQSWAKRAMQRDPVLDVQKEASRVNEQVLLTARTRLGIISGRLCGSGSGASSSQASQAAQVAAAESALAKTAAAAQAITKRAEAAATAMSKQQDELNRRHLAMLQGGWQVDGSKGKAKGKGKEGKDRHQQDYGGDRWQRRNAWREATQNEDRKRPRDGDRRDRR